MNLAERILVLNLGTHRRRPPQRRDASTGRGHGVPRRAGRRVSPGAILRVEALSAGYAGEHVVYDISLEVAVGEAITVIGSNGRKSTLLKAIVGMWRAPRSTVMFDGTAISRLATHRIARRGLPTSRGAPPLPRHDCGREPRPRRLPPPARGRPGTSRLRPLPATRRAAEAGRRHLERWRAADARRRSGADVRPEGTDARRADHRPRPLLATEAYHALAKLRDAGLTLVIAEQQVPLALELASRGYVLENGRIELTGTSQDLLGNPDVQRVPGCRMTVDGAAG